MSDLIENYFNLERPEVYICEVKHYAIGHSHMIVRATPPPDMGEGVWFYFSDVKYFECPIAWRGANFFRKDPTEYFEFLVKLKYEEESPMQWLGYYLFEAPLLPYGWADNTEELTDHRVRILAGSASVSDRTYLSNRD